jgi:hypothetical protein
MTDGVWHLELGALWKRVTEHDFPPDQPLNFIRRLTRDRGWELNFARGAVGSARARHQSVGVSGASGRPATSQASRPGRYQ